MSFPHCTQWRGEPAGESLFMSNASGFGPVGESRGRPAIDAARVDDITWRIEQRPEAPKTSPLSGDGKRHRFILWL
jgi:hypothetical protein